MYRCCIIIPTDYRYPIDRIIPGPLIARPVRNKTLRLELLIPDNATDKILLLGFGGFSIDFPLHDSFLPPGWICLVLGEENYQWSQLIVRITLIRSIRR